jgi:hypothetical protein
MYIRYRIGSLVPKVEDSGREVVQCPFPPFSDSLDVPQDLKVFSFEFEIRLFVSCIVGVDLYGRSFLDCTGEKGYVDCRVYCILFQNMMIRG